MIVIIFRNCCDLNKLCSKYSDDYRIVNYQLGYDDKLYILLSRKAEDGFEYAVISADVDWDKDMISCEEFAKLGKYDLKFNLVQPIGENILLLGSRAKKYANGDTDKNAVIIDKNGEFVREMCFGDGIQDCLTTADGKIFVSYFDEGIFGNCGWSMSDAIGRSGLNMFDEYGNINWSADSQIDDCYAMNVDDDNNLWYYYYSEFLIVKTDLYTQKVFDPHISGANSLLISADQSGIIIDGGYNDPFDFYAAKLTDKSKYDPVYFSDGEKKISPNRMYSNGSKAVFVENEVLYFKQIKSI